MIIERGRFEFHIADNRSEQVFWEAFQAGHWGSDLMQMSDDLLAEDDLVFDIGAWIGPFTLWQAARNRRVVAFEPNPVAYLTLTENISRNDWLGSKVTASIGAITPARGRARMYAFEGSWTLLPFGPPVRIWGQTIEDAVTLYGEPALVRMAIHGGESLVLPAIGPLLRQLGAKILMTRSGPETPAFYDELCCWAVTDISRDLTLLEPPS